MTRDTGRTLNERKVLGGNLVPEGHCLAGDATSARRSGHSAALLPKQLDAFVHAGGKAQLDDRSQVPLDGLTDNLSGMQIGQRIRSKRLELDLSLQEVGDAVGVSKNAVHLWETKEDIEIALPNLLKLSEVLDMSVADLLPPETIEGEIRTRHPQEVLLIERFRLLLPPQRELFLRLVLEMRGDQPPNN